MTEHDELCAKNLFRIWNNKKRDLGLTQEKVAKRANWSGASAFGHFLHGREPLNEKTILKLSEILEVKPSEIDPEFFSGVPMLPDELSEDQKELINDYNALSPELQRAILTQIKALRLQNNQLSH